QAALRPARPELPDERVHGRARHRRRRAAGRDRRVEERRRARAARPGAREPRTPPRGDGLGPLQVHRLRRDRALDRKGLRRAVPPRGGASGRPAEQRLGGDEPLVRAALLPARARGLAGGGGRLRVLVTGGSGFIGSHVLDVLRARGHEPVVFDLVPLRHHEPGTYETVLGDLTSREETRRAVRGCDAVIHLAAVADVNEVVANPVLADRVNVHGTQMILEAARHEGVERVLYGSTIWVYSDSPADDPDEDSALAQPRHLYTATKLAGENYVASYNAQYAGRHTILRFGIPYGPRARPAAVVPSFIARAQRGEPLSIAGDGRQT